MSETTNPRRYSEGAMPKENCDHECGFDCYHTLCRCVKCGLSYPNSEVVNFEPSETPAESQLISRETGDLQKDEEIRQLREALTESIREHKKTADALERFAGEMSDGKLREAMRSCATTCRLCASDLHFSQRAALAASGRKA